MKANPLAGVLSLTIVLLPRAGLASSAPTITSQPQSQSVLAGSDAVFTVGASGAGTLSYQWLFNGLNLTNSTHISGATTATLTISTLVGSDAGGYQVVVTNTHGNATSSVAVLTVLFTNHTHYVDLNSPDPLPPYGDWGTAATNIQDAIDLANPGDAVVIADGIYRLANRVAAGPTNCVAAVVPVSLISVSGPAQTIIDGGGANRCVYLTNGATLSGFTLTNGFTSGNGGGVYCESASAVAIGCVVVGNNAGSYGGGAYQGTLIDCTLAGNSGPLGGAAFNSLLNNCLLTRNSGVYGGGATYSTLNDCTVSSNSYATFPNYATFGGGAYSSTLNNCTLIANTCSQSGGGGIYCTMSNCTLIANSADNFQGGGVDSSTLYSCILSNNSAGQWGGNASESTLNNCLLTGGTAFMGGGARTSTLIGCLVSNNTAIYGWGGGVNASTVSNCVIIGNAAWNSGGGAFSSTLINSLVVSNWATFGGGVNGGCLLTNCVLTGNAGGGPYTGDGGGAEGSSLYNCLLSANSSVRNGGGALQCTLVNCTVTANSASGDGGGVDTSALTNCIVFYNNSPINANYSGTNYMSYCCTMPLPTAGPGDTIFGVSNISSAPLFADRAGGNYRLYPGSAGIDAGNNALVPVAMDLDGNPRVVNGTVDMGAYEFQNSPFIEIQPTNQTAPFGQPAVSFSVVAVGPGTLTYQWLLNGTNILGATSPTLTLTFVQYSQAGNYSVLVMNSFGSALSSNAVLRVVPPTPPAFVSQPAGQTVPVGTNVPLTATAAGAPPPVYQWFFNGTALADNAHYTGTASGTLQIGDIQTSDTGAYFVVATNTGGAVTSSVAAVVVLMPPAIPLPPASQTAMQGSDVRFSAGVSGGLPLSFQWYFNGAPLADGGQISGSATANLTVAHAQFTNGGNYVLVVTNPVGSATSAVAVLTVVAPPTIVQPPANQTVELGASATFSVVATGTLPLSYQWYFYGTNLTDNGRITGSATPTLSISNALLSDTGNYYVVVTNSFGAATSAVAALSVIIIPPAFTQHPQNQAVVAGSNAVFSAGVSGTQPIAYQWFTDAGPLSDGGRISGSATPSLTIAPVQASDAINYWLVASNAAGMATSSVVSLTVVFPVVITQQPSNQTVAIGSLFALSTGADGTGPFGYQWYFNSAPLADNTRISGSETASLSISNAQSADTGNYSVVVTNLLTAATSSVATVTVLAPPAVTLQPIGRSIPLGLTNFFVAAASGAAPLSYQWVLNGTNLPGATNTSYSIAAVGTNDLGVYQFVVSNAVGVAVSSNAWLTVGPVAAWGNNYYGQCNAPPGLSNVTTVAGGYTYSLASRLDGTVAAWGNASPYTNSSFTNVIAVSASPNGALALRSDGSVVGSGYINPLSFKVSPTNAVAVAAGNGFGLALRAEGTVVGWGSFSQLSGGGPLPVPAGMTKVTAISAGYQHALALRNDGTVAAWGYGAVTNVPLGLSNVVAVAAGVTHSLVLKADGTVVAWGSGAGTNIPAGLSNVMAIAAGGYVERTSLSFAVRSNGTLVAWGLSPYNQTNLPSGLSNVVAVVNGAYHTLALVNDGTPQLLRQPVGGTAWSGRDWTLQVAAAGAAPLSYQWLFNGTNIDGATNATLLLPAIQLAAAGNYQVVVSNSLGVAASLAALLAVMDSAPFLLTQPPTNLPVFLGSRVALSTAVAGSGPLQYQWQFNGQNISGATGDTLNFERVHMTNTGSYTFVASNSFGAVTSAVVNLAVQQLVVWGGGNPYGVTNMPSGLTNVAAISANFYGNIALRADGTVAIWGDNGLVATNTAAAVSNAVEVSAGYMSYLVLQANGRPYVWGYGLSSTFSNAIVSQTNIVAIEAANGTCALLKSDGTVISVNYNGASTATELTNAITVEPFDNGFIALRADGTLYAWPGGAGPPPNLTNVLAVASGRYQGLAVKRDGKIQDWPATLLPLGTSNIIAVAAASGSGPEFAVRSDGTVTNGGSFSGSATNIPPGLAKVWRLDAGYNHCLALLADRDFPPVFLHNALNTTNYVVSSKGSPQWFGQTNVTHDGVSAAQSAPIGNNLSSSMRLWVAGPITVSFWWKVSSETNHDFLSFSAGGVVLTNISGEVDWQQCTVSVPAGNQILQWTYAKDTSGSAGQDAGWVDQLQLIPQPPTILAQPASQNVVGPTNVVLAVTATGTPPLIYRWWKNGGLVPGGTAPALALYNAVRTNSGTYWLAVTNVAGGVTSSNATLIVRVPQFLGTPALQPDGSILLSSADLGGGLPSPTDLTNLKAQASTNLVDWVTLPNALTLTNGAIQLQDPDAASLPMRFYRIVEGP